MNLKLARHAYLESCKQDLFFFAKYALGYKDVEESTHRPITDILESPSKRKLIICPRGSFKSSICVVSYSIWLLIKNPNLRIMIDSEIFSNSKNFLREATNHMESPNFISIFGNLVGPHWTEKSIIVKTRTENKKEASITCSGVEAQKTGQHFDIIIGDDYNSPGNSNTQDGCQKVIDHYKHNLAILEPDGTYVVIGTRYTSNDLYGHILRTECDWDDDRASGLNMEV